MFEAWSGSATWNRSHSKPPDGGAALWFDPKASADRIVELTDSDRFGKVDYIKQISEGLGALWELDRTSRLATIIVLSQFPRKLFPGGAGAFEYDVQALALTKKILNEGKLKEYKYFEKMFVLLPLLQSEDREDSKLCLYHVERINNKMKADPKCFSRCVNMEEFCFYVQHQHNIIQQFGRYPARNQVLGRESTAEELAWLKSGESRFDFRKLIDDWTWKVHQLK